MNSKWWKAASIRALRTIAQALIAVIGSSSVLSDIDWRVALSTAVCAGLLSLITSISGLPELAVVDTSEDEYEDE